MMSIRMIPLLYQKDAFYQDVLFSLNLISLGETDTSD